MRGNGNQFCPVCSRILAGVVQTHLDTTYTSAFNYPGALCKGVGTTQPTYTSTAQAQNGTTSTVTLNCPSRRINDGGGFPTYVFGRAWVIDRHPTSDVCCHVETKNPGGASYVGGTVCSTGASTGAQTLLVDFPKVNDPYTYSHFQMVCSVPPTSAGAASALHTYRIYTQRF
jgi:hypothetical protein